MKKVWYPTSTHRNRVGIITDVYDMFVEVQDEEDGTFHIVPYSQTSPANTPILKTENNYIEL